MYYVHLPFIFTHIYHKHKPFMYRLVNIQSSHGFVMGFLSDGQTGILGNLSLRQPLSLSLLIVSFQRGIQRVVLFQNVKKYPRKFNMT